MWTDATKLFITNVLHLSYDSFWNVFVMTLAGTGLFFAYTFILDRYHTRTKNSIFAYFGVGADQLNNSTNVTVGQQPIPQ